jgi:hypothetical protein
VARENDEWVTICEVPIEWTVTETCDNLGLDSLEVLTLTKYYSFSWQKSERELSSLQKTEDLHIVLREWVTKWFGGQQIQLPNFNNYWKGVVEYMVRRDYIKLIHFESMIRNSWKPDSDNQTTMRLQRRLVLHENLETLAQNITVTEWDVINLPTTFVNIWAETPEIVYTSEDSGTMIIYEVDGDGLLTRRLRFNKSFDDEPEMIYRKDGKGKFVGTGQYFKKQTLSTMPSRNQGYQNIYALARIYNVTSNLDFIKWETYEHETGIRRIPYEYDLRF